ncbi:MAG: hypothetical protein HQK53_03150 [Oligoflexia bacterium]|nr:hypothetical protein [Oligoflexia bacterium]
MTKRIIFFIIIPALVSLRLILSAICALFVTSNVYAWANTPEISVVKFPTPPSDCFNINAYCSKTDIVYDGSTRYIQVTLFASIDESAFSNADALTEHYLNFDRWAEFLQGRESIRMVRSKTISAVYENKHPKLITQFDHYYGEAPFPFWSTEIKEVVAYRQLSPSPIEDSEVAYEYELVKGQHDFPEFGEKFMDAVGVKNKYGRMFIKLDKDNNRYLSYSVTQVTPSIDILPSIAAPYIEKIVVTIFESVFNL